MVFDEIEDYSEKYLNEKGYFPLRISIFDRWLTENEASICDVINYNTAIANNSLTKYLDGEERFLSFYSKITHNFKNCVNCSFESSKLNKQSFIDSLREVNMMDVYLPNKKIRIIGGYDRTDLLLFKSKDAIDNTKKDITSHGLFVLKV